MTTQELVAQIRAKNPQYSSLPDDALVNFAVKQKPELKSSLTDFKPITPKQERAMQANDLMNEIVNQKPEEQSHPLRDFGIGVLKGAGRSALDIGGMVAGSNPLTGALGLTPKIVGGYQKAVQPLEEKLTPTNKAQKIGGYAELGAELLVPGLAAKKATEGVRALSTAKKALSLSLPELKNISKSQFKKIFNIEQKELESVGGIVRSEIKKMPEKVNELAVEFKDVLQGSPSKNLNNAKALGKEYWNKTINLFEGENKIMNEKTIRSYLRKSIEDNMAFDSPFQKKEILDKTIEPFMKQIKVGSLRGLEEARGKLSVISRDSTGKLKPAIDSLNKAVKNVIKENLPEVKRIAYDEYSKKMAKLFEVRELLKAKNIASGTSAVKKIGKRALQATGIAGSAYFVKSLFK